MAVSSNPAGVRLAIHARHVASAPRHRQAAPAYPNWYVQAY